MRRLAWILFFLFAVSLPPITSCYAATLEYADLDPETLKSLEKLSNQIHYVRGTNAEIEVTAIMVAVLLFKRYWRKPKQITVQRVNVRWQILFSLLPFTWVIVFHRINKLLMGISLMAGWFILQGVVNFFSNSDYLGFAVGYAVMSPIVGYLMFKWSNVWNNQVILKGSTERPIKFPLQMPTSIKIIAWLLIAGGIFSLVLFALPIIKLSDTEKKYIFGIETSNEIADAYWNVLTITQVGAGIGLLKRVSQARIVAIIIEALGLAHEVVSVLQSTLSVESNLLETLSEQLTLLLLVPISLIIIYYLCKPSTVAYFSNKALVKS